MTEIEQAIKKFEDFFRLYPNLIETPNREAFIDFNKLAEFDFELAQHILDEPEEAIKECKIGEKEVCYELCEHVNKPPIHEVHKLHTIHEVHKDYSYPNYIISNKDKILWLLHVVETPISFAEFKEFFGMASSTLSYIFLRPDDNREDKGLCSQGLCEQHVNSSNMNKKEYVITQKGEEYLTKLELDYSNRNQPQIQAEDTHVRFYNLPLSCKKLIQDIRSKDLNKFLWVEGTISLASDVRPQTKSARFECPGCGNTLTILQLDTKFREPTSCGCGRKGKFKILSKEMIDVRRIVIESLEDTAARFDIFMKGSLCDTKIEPGDNIRVFGVLKEVPIIARDGGKLTRFDLLLEANNLEKIDEDEVILNEEDITRIIEFSKQRDVLDKLSNMFAVSVEGYGIEKKALILQACLPEAPNYPFEKRMKINIACVGIPGSGKTQLGKEACKLYGKSVQVDSSNATAAGLSGAIVRDDFLKSYAVQGGAVVLAQKGLCLIDEIDKINPEISQVLALPMESNYVKIDKATVHRKLPAKGRVLLLGNFVPGIASDVITPKLLNLKSHVFDRIDLIFRATLVSPKALAKRIFTLQKNQKENDLFIKKYVDYASKQSIDYDLTEDVQVALTDFYSIVKNGEGKDGAVGFSGRLLEALRHLVFASAKVRLSRHATMEDAMIAIDIVKKSLSDIGYQYVTEDYVSR